MPKDALSRQSEAAAQSLLSKPMLGPNISLAKLLAVFASWQRVVGASRSVLDFQDKMRSLCMSTMHRQLASSRGKSKPVSACHPFSHCGLPLCLLAGYISKG